MLRTIISIWRDFSSQMKKQNISAYASSTAFFLVFVGDSDADGSLCGDSLYPVTGAESGHGADGCDAGYCRCHGGESGR